jgi:hypothetical protein
LWSGYISRKPWRPKAEITAGDRIDKIGRSSALAIIEASETTAKDIEEAPGKLP